MTRKHRTKNWIVWFRPIISTKSSSATCILNTSFRIWIRTFPFQATFHFSGKFLMFGRSLTRYSCRSTRYFSWHFVFRHISSRQLTSKRFLIKICNDDFNGMNQRLFDRTRHHLISLTFPWCLLDFSLVKIQFYQINTKSQI